ncbi:MAG: HAD-IA family hydrolase [Pseudomonadota bacterium]
MTPPRAVLFDLDGTLVDTAEEFVVVVQALRAEHGRAPMDEARIRRSVSNGALALVCLALDLQPDSKAAEQQRLRLLELYSEVLGSSARPYPGIPMLLRHLGDLGIPWGIATNKPRIYTEPLLAELNLQPAAGSVVCPDDVSQRKPHPESLLRNCEELACLPEHTVYIGDHRRDIEAGRSAGMYTIAATYGYIEADDDPTSWRADAYAASSLELHDLIFN